MRWRSFDYVLRVTLIGSHSLLMCDLKRLRRASSTFGARESGEIVTYVVCIINVSP